MELSHLLPATLHSSIGMNHIYVAAGVALTYVLLLKLTVGGSWRSVKGEPPLIGHRIPFIGHALRFAKDKKAFLVWADQMAHGKPFSILMGGRKNYIFADPSDCAAVHRNNASLSFRGFYKFVSVKIWGYKSKDADEMYDLKDHWHKIDVSWLLDPIKNGKLFDLYLGNLHESLAHLDDQIDASETGTLRLDGLRSVLDVQGRTTCLTFYGKRTVDLNPSLVEDLLIMLRDGFWPMIFNAPRWLFPKPYAAQNRLITAFGEMASDIDNRPDVCEYVQERIRFLTSRNVNFRSQGSDNLQIMFGSLVNSVPATYLALLHILTEPGLLQEVRAELQEAAYPQAADAAIAGGKDAEKPDLRAIIPSKLPLLRSIWFETLRMHSNSLIVREVIAPTELTSKDGQRWHLKEGGVVSMPCSLIHFNERLHPDAENFHARRFMDTALGGEGESAAKTTKPFGGGINHCPGRSFGEKQWMSLIAGLVWRYDIKIASEKWEIPVAGEFNGLAKEPTIWLEFSKRQGLKM